jgi:polysaccharide pyruvyl transferase WcaK-like protein
VSKRIIILNDGLGPNKGDQAILRAMLNTLKPYFPRADISVLRYSWRLRDLGRDFHAIRQSDLLILGGGQALQDQTSPAFLVMVLSKIGFARMLRKRVMGYALGVGPLKTRVARGMARSIVNQFEMITVREPASKRCLEELGVNKPPITVTADATFLLEPAASERAKEILWQEGMTHGARRLVAIAPRRWFHYHHSLIPVRYKARLWGGLMGEESFGRLKQILAGVADWLIAQENASILFVPMRRSSGRFDPGQDDDRVASEITELMRGRENVRILSGDYSPEEMKGLLGQMDLIIGMRMHALILGGAMGVPVIGIGITKKFAPLMGMMGQDSHLIDVQDLDERVLREEIMAALSNKEEVRQELLRRAENLRARAMVNNDMVLMALGRAQEHGASFP